VVFGVIGVLVLRDSFAFTSGFRYYSQKDPAWANKPYPYKPGTVDQSDIKISRSGCGPASMAMVASSLSRSTNPAAIALWYGPRYHTSNGTDPAVYPVFAKDYGLRYSSLGYFSNTSTRQAIQYILSQKNTLVIVHAGPGHFTGSGHIMVIRAYNSFTGQYTIADPNNSSNNRGFTSDFLIHNGNLKAAYGFAK